MTFHNDFYSFLLKNATNKICVLFLQHQDVLPCFILKEVDFIKPETDTIVSFTQVDKILKAKAKGIEYEPFSFRRVRTKIGRMVSKVLSEFAFREFKIADKDIEDFTNLYKSHFVKEQTKFIIVEGEDIRSYYDEESYHISGFGRHGSLWNSCMRYKNRLKFLDLYLENAKLLVLVNAENKVKGRALLWDSVHNVDTGKVIKFMDRIYTTEDYIVNIFKDWCIQNGYYSKLEQSSRSERYIVSPDNQVIFSNLEIKLKSKLAHYPYLDTFKFFDISKNILKNIDQDFDYVLVQVDGSVENTIRETEESDEEPLELVDNL